MSAIDSDTYTDLQWLQHQHRSATHSDTNTLCNGSDTNMGLQLILTLTQICSSSDLVLMLYKKRAVVVLTIIGSAAVPTHGPATLVLTQDVYSGPDTNKGQGS